MPELCENTRIDTALSRLIELTPYVVEESRQQDWNLARDFLRRRLAGTALRNVYDNDDLLQECLSRAFEHRHTWKGNAPLSGWFFRIAYNLILDTLRSKARVILVRYEEEQPPELHFEDASAPVAGEPSRQLTLFREWVHDTQDDALVQFLDALIEQLNSRKPRTRMRFVMDRLGLQREQYKALYERLKRASSRYPQRFELGLSC